MTDTILEWLKRPITQIDKFIAAQRPIAQPRYRCPACGSYLINTRGHGTAHIENTDYCQCLTCSLEGQPDRFQLTPDKGEEGRKPQWEK